MGIDANIVTAGIRAVLSAANRCLARRDAAFPLDMARAAR